jgi:hypothetical protein
MAVTSPVLIAGDLGPEHYENKRSIDADVIKH